MSIPRILVVEDNPDLRIEIVDYLKFCHYTATGADSIQQMQDALRDEHWNILLLDLTLPDGDGLATAKKLRSIYGLKLGIIMVTARGHVEDRIEGISSGADAYLVKPINLKELKVTIDQLNLRISELLNETSSPTHWLLDQQALELICPNNHRIGLTVTESSLLKALLNQPGQAVTRDELCNYLPPGNHHDNTRRLDSILSRLRSKTKKETGISLPIHTLRNKGYVFAVNHK